MNLLDGLNLGELMKRAIKYLVEGLMVVLEKWITLDYCAQLMS